jgi:hypothetical protein
MLNCRDFRRKWDELLDAEATPAGFRHDGATGAGGLPAHPAVEDGEAALREHASGCAACRQLAARYHVLRHALRAWSRTPLPSADRPSGSWPRRPAWPVVASLASVAAAAIAMALLLPAVNRGVQRLGPGRPPIDGPIASQDPGAPAFQRALAEATSATWDLARSASEPAARISRDMLDATLRPENDRCELRPGPDATRGVVPAWFLIPQAPDAATAAAVLQQVGDHLAAGVRPLSSTARQAFGFLIGQGRDRPGSYAKGSTAKGA